MKNIDDFAKAFDSSTKEPEIYKMWEENGLFKPETLERILKESHSEIKKPFTITLPPTNANGKPHLGHMCGYSFQDLMGRYNRMKGHPTLLLPGKDHASIQTEAVFTKILAEKGINKWELGQEKFYDMCYEFCTENAKSAQKYEKGIGISADWDRELFTLDPKLNKIINDTFFQMFKEGLIYRGKYIINQCPHCKTALADIDTEHEEMRGIFAYIIYPFVSEKDNDLAEKALGYRGIMIATTRPETMLADTAVAVNPEDERYKHFIGKKLLLPFVKREIPVIADVAIDIEVGTGALKVTPAHSPIDFEIGLTHNLEVINVINEEGKMTGDIPEKFKGMGTLECSKALVKELDEMKLLNKIENIKHEVTVCERCKTPIEPIISYQWFVNTKPLAQKAIEILDTRETEIIPEGQHSALRFFFENIKPWCISRQLWWGQRIPVWYSGGKEMYDWLQDNEGKTISDWEKDFNKKATGTGKVILSEEKPVSDPDWTCKDRELYLEPETDLFDTWFSSGQWPFSTLGGPGNEDFKKYYPTQVMETARDILFWWVARMMMLGIYKTGVTPFEKVFLHGMILASDGSKMSKSKGNGVEPEEVFKKFGADALRMWYYNDALPGSNTPIQEEKIKGHRFFINKIWNASRFILMNIEDSEVEKVVDKMKNYEEIWVGENIEDEYLKLTIEHVKKIQGYIENFKFHLAAEGIREFFWGILCDKWIEETKNEIKDLKEGSDIRIEKLARLIFVLKQTLIVMHPLIPYITESVWQELKKVGFTKEFLITTQMLKNLI